MHLPFKIRSVSTFLSVAAMTGVLAACGGGSDNNNGQMTGVSGTAAVGAGHRDLRAD